MNRYETVFIMTPVLSAEQVAETVEKYRAYLKDNGATIDHEESWGLRKLAYPFRRSPRASTNCLSLRLRLL